MLQATISVHIEMLQSLVEAVKKMTNVSIKWAIWLDVWMGMYHGKFGITI